MANMVWKGFHPYGFGYSRQLSLYKFFDPRSYSMRKGCDGEEVEKEEENGENSGQLLPLPVNCLNGDRLQGNM